MPRALPPRNEKGQFMRQGRPSKPSVRAAARAAHSGYGGAGTREAIRTTHKGYPRTVTFRRP